MSKVKDFFKGWSKFELCWLVLSTVIMIVISIIWGDNTLALDQWNHRNSRSCSRRKRKSKHLFLCNDQCRYLRLSNI